MSVRRSAKSRRDSKVKRFSLVQIQLTVVFVLLLALLWVVLNIPALQDFRTSREIRDQQREKVETLEAEVANLERQEREFERGPRELERAIRERYKMVKPGERLIEIEEESNDDEEIEN